MSSIPHDQTSADTTGRGTHAVAGWLWALLAAGMLALLLLMGWQATHPAVLTEATPPAMPAASPPLAAKPQPAPAVIDMDAEPIVGNPMPRYPADVLDAGIEGDVIARLQIDSSGRVTDAVIVSHQGQQDVRLDQAAIEALLQWRFHPAMRDGKAIASVVQVPVEFRTGR